MGDNRYYTYLQLIDVGWTTGLSIFSLAGLFVFSYRKSKAGSTTYSLTLTATIFLFSITRMVETVFPDLVVAARLREMQLVLLSAAIGLCFLDKDFWIRHYRLLLSICLLLMFFFSDFVLTNYAFHHLQYSIYYKALLLILSGLGIRHLFFRNSLAAVKYKRLWIILPLLLYTVMVLINFVGTDYSELLLASGIIIYTNRWFALDSESAYAILAFDQIGDILTNYIFVIDKQHKLIYSNQMAQQSDFFENINFIDDLKDIFQCDNARYYTHLEKDYIHIKKADQNYYFTYSYADLAPDQNPIGSVITLTNITDLIELLDHVAARKAESKKRHHQLKHYSKVVYHLEREKAISQLLTEIMTNRDKQLTALVAAITATKSKLNSDDIETEIEQVISQTNTVLEEVRQTVTKYREYYEN